MTDDLLPLSEAATRSGLSASHLRLLAREGRVAARKLGRDWFTTLAAVEAYLNDPTLRSRDPYKRRRSD